MLQLLDVLLRGLHPGHRWSKDGQDAHRHPVDLITCSLSLPASLSPWKERSALNSKKGKPGLLITFLEWSLDFR